MNKTISLLGSTGSIGRQTIEVAASLGYSIGAISANRSVELAEQQARRLKPRLVVMADEACAKELRLRLADTEIRVLSGEGGLIEAATLPEADTVLTAVVGTVGLKPTLAAIDCGKRIALANKETLVCAGDIVMRRAEQKKAEIIPVDSEHSAIFQCLRGENSSELKRIILTGSGGPFFGRSLEEMRGVTREQALRHPNWSMGAKITIDSATMMNKGLEFIEAMHLFGVTPDMIQVVVHRESIIHSMVEFCDNSVIAQLGAPDMRLPIQLALSYPQRCPSICRELDLFSCGSLSFHRPDLEAFPCLALAMETADRGGVCCSAMNAANEVAVGLFLDNKIGFTDIFRLVSKAVEAAPKIEKPGIDDVLAADRQARERTLKDSACL